MLVGLTRPYTRLFVQQKDRQSLKVKELREPIKEGTHRAPQLMINYHKCHPISDRDQPKEEARKGGEY